MARGRHARLVAVDEAARMFTIVHPVTGDWAEADDLPSAERAAQVLRADALDAGTCTSPRVKCLIIVAAGELDS